MDVPAQGRGGGKRQAVGMGCAKPALSLGADARRRGGRGQGTALHMALSDGVL